MKFADPWSESRFVALRGAGSPLQILLRGNDAVAAGNRETDCLITKPEQAFLAELAGLVSHLTERLSGGDDGKPKVFRDSAIENLTEFFERFRKLNIRSNGQLDEPVQEAREIVQGGGHPA